MNILHKYIHMYIYLSKILFYIYFINQQGYFLNVPYLNMILYVFVLFYAVSITFK